jgi:hypothetical protein
MVDIPTAALDSTPAPDASVSRLDEMAALLEGLESTESGEEVQAEAAETPAPVDFGEEAESDEGEEAAEEAVAKPTEEEPKKPTRFQRIRAQRDQADKRAEAAEAERRLALILGHQWKADAMARQQLLARVLQETGYQLDPRDAKLFDVQLQEQTKKIEELGHKKLQEERAVTAQQRAQNDLADKFYNEAEGLTKQFKGIQRSEILEAYAFSMQAGRKYTMAQVAANLARAVAGGVQADPVKAQVEGNRAAPKTIRPGRNSTGLKSGHSLEAQESFLLSLEGG